jgi:hypothetical protein
VHQQELTVGVAYYANREWPAGVAEYQVPIFTRQEWKFIVAFLGRRDLRSFEPLQRVPWIRAKYESLPEFSS